ncbi:MAG: biotin/lipoyl-binding protein, partial [Cellulomonas sp.]
MTRRRRIIINSALVGVLALVGGGTWYALHPSSASADSATTVRTATVATGDVKTTISASGNLAAATTANQSFSTSGTIASISVSVGQVVTVGQVLATIDPTDAQNAVA